MNQTEKDLAAAKIEAEALATWLWRKHYEQDAPGWRLCDSVAGGLSQIDNMVCTLEKPAGRCWANDVQAYLAAAGLVAVPSELLHDLHSLVIECRDEQPMDFDPLDALNTRILAAQGRGTP